jgi:hypothetical protein
VADKQEDKNSVVIRVTDNASYEELRTQLTKEANLRALALRTLTGKILTYALDNQHLYNTPLSDTEEVGGEAFDCNVSVEVRKQLHEWAAESNRKLGQHCAFILAKSLEDNLLTEVSWTNNPTT